MARTLLSDNSFAPWIGRPRTGAAQPVDGTPICCTSVMRLRQIALVASDLRPVEQAIVAELGLEVCFRDPGIA